MMLHFWEKKKNRTGRNRLFSMFLALTLVLGTLAVPSSVSFAEEVTYRVTVKNKIYPLPADADKLPAGMSYNHATKTLTLDNYQGAHFSLFNSAWAAQKFIIHLKGDNKITEFRETVSHIGIYCSNPLDFTAEPGATLTIDIPSSYPDQSKAICTYEAPIRFFGGTYYLSAMTAHSQTYAIYGERAGGAVQIHEPATLFLKAYNQTLVYNPTYDSSKYNVTGAYNSASMTFIPKSAESEAVLTVKKAPTITSYNEGDTLNLSGLVVNDGTKDISVAQFAANGITTVPANGVTLTQSDNTIRITKGKAVAMQSITIDPYPRIRINETMYTFKDGDYEPKLPGGVSSVGGGTLALWNFKGWKIESLTENKDLNIICNGDNVFELSSYYEKPAIRSEGKVTLIGNPGSTLSIRSVPNSEGEVVIGKTGILANNGIELKSYLDMTIDFTVDSTMATRKAIGLTTKSGDIKVSEQTSLTIKAVQTKHPASGTAANQAIILDTPANFSSKGAHDTSHLSIAYFDFKDSAAYDIPAGNVGTTIDEVDVSKTARGVKPLTFSKKSGPEWLKVSETGILSGIRPATSQAETTATIEVTDGGTPKTADIEIKVGAVAQQLTITGVTATDRVYDYGNEVVLTGGTLQGVASGHDVNFTLGKGTVANNNAGVNKPVTTAITLTGADAGKYTLIQPTGITVNITKDDVSFLDPTANTVDAKFGQKLSDVEIPPTLMNPIPAGNWAWNEPGVSVGAIGTQPHSATFTPYYSQNYNSKEETIKVNVTKGDAPVIPDQYHLLTTTTGPAITTTVDLSGLLPSDRGVTTYALGTVTDANNILDAPSPSVTGGELTFTVKNTAADANTATIPVPVTMDNYQNVTINVHVVMTDKIIPTVTLKAVKKIYDGLAILTDAFEPSAKNASNEKVDGNWSFVSPPSTDAGHHAVTLHFAPTDSSTYATVDKGTLLTIDKATPTGIPTCEVVTEDGKTLNYVTIQPGTITPAGTISWDNSAATVEANTPYGWTFTPNSPYDKNYTKLKGTLIPYPSVGYTVTVTGGTSDKTSAKAGETVSLTATVPTGKYFGGWTASPSVTFAAASAATTTFPMPANDVTITANFSDIYVPPTTYLVSVMNGSPNKYFAAAGDYVVITADLPPADQVFDRWTSVDGLSFDDASSVITGFTMPAKDVAMTALFKASGTPSTETPSTGGGGGGGGGSSSPATAKSIQVEKQIKNGHIESNLKEAKPGDTVILTPRPDEGYVLSSIKVNDKNGNAIELTKRSDSTFSFRMPSTEVTIDAEFVPLSVSSIMAGYQDVKPDNWFYSSVEYVVKNKLMVGTAPDEFSPNMETSRAMIVTILYRLTGSPNIGQNSNFSDVSAGGWYSDAVAWAAENNVVGGFPDGSFKPDDPLTREQLVTVLFNFAKMKGYDTNGTNLTAFNDANEISGYALPAMQWAVKHGIVNGIGGNMISPKSTATRAQMATILKGFIEDFVK